MFQCQPGSIKAQVDDAFHEASATGFNASLVRLKRDMISARYWSAISCFNASLVRLKPHGPVPGVRGGEDLFQCQPGSIKACRVPGGRAGRLGFNASLVRLKRDSRFSCRSALLCFNASLVRLKRDRDALWRHRNLCFNASLVRLKLRVARINLVFWIIVSMPAWFD